MGFIRILRWRIGGAMHRFSGRAQPAAIGSFQRAAVFLFGLGTDHAAVVLDQFPQREARALEDEVSQFSGVDEDLAREVWDEFLTGLSVAELPSYVSRSEPEEVARAFVRSNPEEVARRVRLLWLDSEEKFVPSETDDDDAFLELGYEQLEPAQKAAVFMMWLPPELSAMVLQKFSPALVHQITSTLVELPFVLPCAREVVLSDFMEGVTLGIPGLSLGDVGLPVVVEAFVRSDPAAVAKRLETMWLSQSSVVVPSPPSVQPAEGAFSPLEKCAIFLQSLSLPLAYRLLAEMDEDEVSMLLEAVDKLEGVGPDTRKEVLQELMMASRPGGSAEPQPVHVLGKAMGSMIRKRPGVVVRQIRKHWLGA